MPRVRTPCRILALSLCLAPIARPGFAEPAASGFQPAPLSPWAVAVFGGVLTENAFATSLYNPGHLADSYLAGADITYTYYSLPALPLKLELDASAAKRFGQDNRVGLRRRANVPMDQISLERLSLHEFSHRSGRKFDYVTGVSPWELHSAHNDHGSRFLNYFLVEFDFKPSETSPFEVYVGWHHRSGAWGLWNGTYGGSTYEIAGLRYHF